jgi:hypothetical protein
LIFLRARYYESTVGRFFSRDNGGVDYYKPDSLNRWIYGFSNPVNYTDPSGHVSCSFINSGFSCIISTSDIGSTIDRIGEQFGIENFSQIASEATSTAGLILDTTAEAVDFAASAIVTTGIAFGATSGAVIALPGGGTALVTGGTGASVGWAMTEIGVRPLIMTGNILASFATLATMSSELISGETSFEAILSIDSGGFDLCGHLVIGSASQVSILATAAGWIVSLSYLSLGIQTMAVLGDLGVISPKPIVIMW